MKRALVVLALAVVLLGAWWKRTELSAAFAKSGPAVEAARRAPPPVPVVVATAARKPLPVTIDAVGTVQPLASIQIKARIDSQIASIEVVEGARVKEGDLLLTLDNRALRAQLAQAEALVVRDTAQVTQARRDLGRTEDLLAKRIGTEVQRDTAATGVKVQEAQLAANEAQRQNLAAALSYTEVRAPVSGRIGSIALKAGTTVKAGDAQAIMTVNQIDPIYVTFSVPQSLFPDLRRALSAGEVAVEARVRDEMDRGTVAFVENTVDLATGTVLAKAIMPNREERLWPGSFVSVRVVLGVEAEAVAVPSAAVQLGQTGAYLFVVGDNRKAELRSVTIARTVGAESVVSDGLRGGEAVVVDGQLRLVHGAEVVAGPGRGSDGVAKGSETGANAPRRG